MARIHLQTIFGAGKDGAKITILKGGEVFDLQGNPIGRLGDWNGGKIVIDVPPQPMPDAFRMLLSRLKARKR